MTTECSRSVVAQEGAIEDYRQSVNAIFLSERKIRTHKIILEVHVPDVLSFSESFVSRFILVPVLFASRGERDRIRHEARLILALPVRAVIAPLLSVSNCQRSDDGEAESYVNSSDASIAAEML